MTQAQSDAQRMTRAELNAQIRHYSQLEREQLAQLISAEKSGGVESPALSDREAKVQAAARRRLNGHASALLKAAPTGPSTSEIRIELEATRLILQALNRKSVEAAALEAVERAEKLAPTEAGLIRELTLVTARWQAVSQRMDRFYEEAGGAVAAALPLSHLPIRICEIDTRSFATVDDVVAKSLEAGTVSAADLRKARSV